MPNQVIELSARNLDRAEEAFRALHEHQTALVPISGGPAVPWPQSWPKCRARVARVLSGDARSFCLAIERDGRVIAIALCAIEEGDPSWDMGDELGYIDSLAVVAGERGAGLGRKLIDAALVRFGELGMRNFWIESMTENEDAIRLYESYARRESVALIGPVPGAGSARPAE